MSWSAIPVVNNTGVRPLRTLGGLGSAVDPDTVRQLLDNGWNPQSVDNLVSLGASDEQLLALPFPASEAEMRAAYASLYAQLLANPSTPTAKDAATQQSQFISQEQSARIAKALATNPWTNGVVPFGASGDLSSVGAASWLAQNAGTILLVIAAIAIVPPLVKKL